MPSRGDVYLVRLDPTRGLAPNSLAAVLSILSEMFAP